MARSTTALSTPHLHQRRWLKPLWRVLSLATLITLPWQVGLVLVTLIAFGLWRLACRIPGIERAPRGLKRMSEPLARALFVDESHYVYLPTVVGLGIYTPLLFAGSIGYQVAIAGVGSGGSLDVAALFVTHALWLGPNHLFFAHVTTLLHQLAHQRRVFKPRFRWLEAYVGYVLGSLYGHVPENFAMGHIRIHHRHDNSPEDITSTLDLDRASAHGWFQYHARFVLYWSGAGVVDFFRVRRRPELALRQGRGMLAFYGAGALLCAFSGPIGAAYWLLPHLMIINFLSAINYTWHAFIDPEDPSSAYGNSFTIVNAEQDVWDEAYHVSHHARPSAPWKQMRRHFEENHAHYIERRSLVMENTQVFEVFFYLVSGNLQGLARRVRPMEGSASEEAIVDLLRARTRPIESLAAAYQPRQGDRGPCAGVIADRGGIGSPQPTGASN